MKKVYYYNEKARAIISQEELRERIRMGECYRLWHKYEHPTTYNKWSDETIEFPEIITYSYKLNEIPLHPDWDTIVEDDLDLDMTDYDQLLDLVHKKATKNLVMKLFNNIHRIQDYKNKGIEFY